MKAAKHTHRAVPALAFEAGYSWPIPSAKKPNPSAHGNITVMDRCKCGARRYSNVNQWHIERGEWIEAER